MTACKAPSTAGCRLRTGTCCRRTLLLAIVLVPLLITGCNETRGVHGDNIDLVTWFIEDLVHGNPRNPQELVLPESSPEMQRIATWLIGNTIRNEYHPPSQIATRRDRWLALKALFLQDQAVILDDGLVAANPNAPKKDQAYALSIIDAENLDRRAIDALLINLARANRTEAAAWLDRSKTARIALATQHGGKRWIGKY